MGKKKEVHVDGMCEKGFEEVRNSFRKNFEEGWEKQGATVAVYYKGKLVVDLWGGYAEKKYRRLWREETLANIFSCSKSIAAVCMSIMVDRGHCDYNDLVVKYWPEYGQNGKESTTIEQVLSHKAGVPHLQSKVSLEQLTSPEAMAALIEAETPVFPPGTKTAYHPLTYGWIIDIIFMRVDPKQRSIGQFFKEEIADNHHVDLHLGDCAVEEYRLSRLVDVDRVLAGREIAYDRKIVPTIQCFYKPGSYFKKAFRNMENFGKDFTFLNNPDMRIYGQPAVNGIATARGMAQAHQLFIDNSLISKSTLEKFKNPLFEHEFDHTIGEIQSKGHGFMYTKSPNSTWQIGHSGLGGQIIKMDLQKEMTFAYLTNALKAGAGEHVFTANRLQYKVYDCIKRLEAKTIPTKERNNE